MYLWALWCLCGKDHKTERSLSLQEASVRGWLREFQLLEENRLNFGDPLNYCQGVTVEKLMRTPTLTMLISLGLWLLTWTPVFWAPMPGALLSTTVWLTEVPHMLTVSCQANSSLPQTSVRDLLWATAVLEIRLPGSKILPPTLPSWRIRSKLFCFVFLITSVPLYLCSSLK